MPTTFIYGQKKTLHATIEEVNIIGRQPKEDFLKQFLVQSSHADSTLSKDIFTPDLEKNRKLNID